MILTLEEAKNYLRVDTDDEDATISTLISAAQSLCMDVARIDDEAEFESAGELAKTAVFYTLAALYENRESLDYCSLTLRLRALLHGIRQEQF